MHRYFFSLRVALVVILAAVAVASIDLFVNGFAVVHDPDDLLAGASLADGSGEARPMRAFAEGYWAGRPRTDGSIRLTCRSGHQAFVSYVTPGERTTYTVRAEDCEPVATRRTSP